MKVKLLVVGGDVKAAEILPTLPAIVGRGREATITLPHPLVSRTHCELFEEDGVLMVRDLGSLNGTYVGSRRVNQEAIPSGELLTIATINFRVVYLPDEVEDETDTSAVEGNDDSTHGPGKSRSSREVDDDSDERVRERKPVASQADHPVERDTEWQVGNVPPRRSPDDDEDLGSLLNDLT